MGRNRKYLKEDVRDWAEERRAGKTLSEISSEYDVAQSTISRLLKESEFRSERVTDEERFWSKVKKRDDGVWEWTGSRQHGYGIFHIGGDNVKAHRYSWELHYGPIPEGLVVCHINDLRHDVNPENLFLGTQRDNMMDAIQKGRHPTSKLSLKEAEEIREKAQNGKDYDEICNQYGVSKSLVSQIKNEKIWI